jgi:type IV secretion system protein VirB6
MAFSAFTDINSWLETVFQPLATDLPGLLAAGVIPLVASGVSLQVAFHGFAVIRGTGGSNHFLDVFAKAMRAFLVFALCLAGNAYVSNIRPIIPEVQTSLTQYVTNGSGSGDINAELDGVMETGITTFETVQGLLYYRSHLSFEICLFGGCQGVHLDGVPAIILQSIVSLVILAFGIFAFIDVQVISQSLVIVLAFGPLFLSGFAFESTAKWAEGWLTAAVKYLMTAIVLLVVVIAAKEQAEKFVDLFNDSASSTDLIPDGGTIGAPLYDEQAKLLAILIVLSALLAKASGIAADMVGSMGIASNAIGMVRSAAGSATGAMKGAIQGGMGGGGVKGAMKGMAMGAAGMHVPGGGQSSRPVGGPRGGGAGSNDASTPKSLGRRARQGVANRAAYALGTAAGQTIGRTSLHAKAQQARRSLANVFRASDPVRAASVQSSKRAGTAFKDAWQRAKRP